MKIDAARFGDHLDMRGEGENEIGKILKTGRNDDGCELNGDFRGRTVELWRKIMSSSVPFRLSLIHPSLEVAERSQNL